MKTLMDISQMDLKTAKRFYTLAKTEETDYNIPMTCYFLEQSIEKALKGIMDLFSIEYKFDHEIASKIIDIRNNKNQIKDYETLNLILQDLELMANEISIWNSKPRYIINFMQTNRTIDVAMKIAEKLSSYIDTIKPVKVIERDIKNTFSPSLYKMELIGKNREESYKIIRRALNDKFDIDIELDLSKPIHIGSRLVYDLPRVDGILYHIYNSDNEHIKSISFETFEDIIDKINRCVKLEDFIERILY